VDLSKELKVALNTGKVEIGYKVAIKTLVKKKAKLVVVSSDMPESLLANIKTTAGDVPLHKYSGSSWELGGLCGKPYHVTTITIIEPGESSILAIKEG